MKLLHIASGTMLRSSSWIGQSVIRSGDTGGDDDNDDNTKKANTQAEISVMVGKILISVM
jgi:hypothetical protein